VLSVGSSVGIHVGDEPRDVQAGKGQPLPKEEFTLNAVALTGDQITDTAIKRLVALRNLQAISLYNSNVSDAGMREVAALPSLTALELIVAPAVTEAGLAHLDMKKLQKLVLINDSITDASQELLGGANLQWLHLEGCPNVTGAGFIHLKSMPNLKNLVLRSMTLNEDGWRQLSELKHLDSLVVMQIRVPDRRLGLGPSLSRLTLVDTQLTDAAIEELCGLKELKYLDVQKNKISTDGVKKLTTALRQCTIISDHGTFEPAAGNP